jgi:hypothetical protein
MSSNLYFARTKLANVSLYDLAPNETDIENNNVYTFQSSTATNYDCKNYDNDYADKIYSFISSMDELKNADKLITLKGSNTSINFNKSNINTKYQTFELPFALHSKNNDLHCNYMIEHDNSTNSTLFYPFTFQMSSPTSKKNIMKVFFGETDFTVDKF